MAATDELPLYPIGQVGFGVGTLKTATLGRFTTTNGAALRHALAQSPSGVSFGNFECSGTIEFEVSENGIERDVVTAVAKGEKKTFRFKDATKTYQIIGVFNSVDWTSQRPDPVKVAANFVGKLIL